MPGNVKNQMHTKENSIIRMEQYQRQLALRMLDGKSENVFIGGFSQGCSLSLATFLMLQKYQLGGVLGLSGMLALNIKDW